MEVQVECVCGDTNAKKVITELTVTDSNTTQFILALLVLI